MTKDQLAIFHDFIIQNALGPTEPEDLFSRDVVMTVKREKCLNCRSLEVKKWRENGYRYAELICGSGQWLADSEEDPFGCVEQTFAWKKKRRDPTHKLLKACKFTPAPIDCRAFKDARDAREDE